MPGIVVKPCGREFCTETIGVFSSKVLKVFAKPADADLISLKDDKDRLIGDWKRLRRGEQNPGTAGQQTRFAF
jgi:hypothetical protein